MNFGVGAMENDPAPDAVEREADELVTEKLSDDTGVVTDHSDCFVCRNGHQAMTNEAVGNVMTILDNRNGVTATNRFRAAGEAQARLLAADDMDDMDPDEVQVSDEQIEVCARQMRAHEKLTLDTVAIHAENLAMLQRMKWRYDAMLQKRNVNTHEVTIDEKAAKMLHATIKLEMEILKARPEGGMFTRKRHVGNGSSRV